jgi:hypothetical protein
MGFFAVLVIDEFLDGNQIKYILNIDIMDYYLLPSLYFKWHIVDTIRATGGVK